MNWSKEWSTDPAAVKAIRDDEDKIYADTANFGTGWSKDGKHIPFEEVYDVEEDIARTLITVKNGNKNETLDCYLVGDLALDYSDDGWNIYHVPTLSLFSKAVPPSDSYSDEGKWVEEFNYDKDQLLRWMAKVQTNYPTSWIMLRQLTPDDYADKGQVAKDIILKWCLSVKVK